MIGQEQQYIFKQEAMPPRSREQIVRDNTSVLDSIPQYNAAHSSILAVLTEQSIISDGSREITVVVGGRSASGKGTASRSEAIRLAYDPVIRQYQEEFGEPVQIVEGHYADMAIAAQVAGEIPFTNDKGRLQPKVRNYSVEERPIITNFYRKSLKNGIARSHEEMRKKQGKDGFVIAILELSQLNLSSNGESIDIHLDNGDSLLLELAQNPNMKPGLQFWWMDRNYDERYKTKKLREK